MRPGGGEAVPRLPRLPRLLGAGACATSPSPLPAAEVKVKVVRSGNQWTADYIFDRDAPAWGFFRSAVTEHGCGAMFGLAAEAAAQRKGGDFFTFWRGLIDANRADGIVSQEEWMAEVARLSGDPLIVANIRQMVDVGVAYPARSLAAIFTRAGVAHSLSADGRLRLA